MRGPFFDYDYDEFKVSNLNPEDIEVIEKITPQDIERLRNNEQVSVAGYWLYPYWRGETLHFDLNDRYTDHHYEDDPTPYDEDDERVITFTCIRLTNIDQ